MTFLFHPENLVDRYFHRKFTVALTPSSAGKSTNQRPAELFCVGQWRQSKTCTAELSFLFTFCQPAIAFHEIYSRSRMCILLDIEKTLYSAVRFFWTPMTWVFPPAAVALHRPPSPDQLIQNLPAPHPATNTTPLLSALRWKWKTEGAEPHHTQGWLAADFPWKKMNFLKNIAEKAKSVTDSPTRTYENGNSPQEGFICPLCLESFDLPAALQSHFEERHSEEGDINGPPSPR